MKRHLIQPRVNFGATLEEQGLSFHSWDLYWKEDCYYQFSLEQIEEIESATEELHAMCINAVKIAIESNRLGQLGIPEVFWDEIRNSFMRDDFSLYGRFDFAYDGKSAPKMLEYNADTPTSLLESAVCQWYWMEDCFPQDDQFNSLHESLVSQWQSLPQDAKVYVASIAENEEDWVCATYIMDTVVQAGYNAQHIYIEDIGWDSIRKCFVDVDGNAIRYLFKLYPWEWLMREEFGAHILECQTQFVEPLWKSVMSCKGLLALLWELYPNHPNLLETYFSPAHLTSYAKKPFYSREGANVQLVANGNIIAEDEGPYGKEGYVYQALCELPKFEGHYPVIGSWVVGGKAAGMCIREDDTPITTNMSHFIPHIIVN
jgi:glutathionylspermidine synthase